MLLLQYQTDKFLIEYNSNSLEGIDEEKKEAIDIEFTEQNTDLKILLIIDC